MKSIVIFASGQGSNAQAIVQYFKSNPQVQISLIVCNNPLAGVLKMAEMEQIPVQMIDRKSIREQELINQLKEHNPDIIVLAGFLWKIPEGLIQVFPQKIINLHPALLPKYGGKGMYGIHVHEAVLAAEEKESGITIHRVNEHYDEGAIIVQARCSIFADDSPESVAERIHQLEHYFLPRTIDFLLSPSLA